MKNYKKYTFLFAFILIGMGTTMTSCKTGEGCANTNNYEAVDISDRKSAKRGKSNLLSKKQRKRVAKRKEAKKSS